MLVAEAEQEEEKIIQRIFGAGSQGIKKADLRKEFSYSDLDNALEHLVNKGNVCTEKKGQAYYFWHKDHYFKNLLNSDPKFRATYEIIQSLEHSFNKSSHSLTISVENLNENI